MLSPDSVSSSLMGVERCDTEPSSSRSSSESSSEELLMASSLGGGGALAAVFRWSSVSSLLLLCLQSHNNVAASKTPGLELGSIFLTSTMFLMLGSSGAASCGKLYTKKNCTEHQETDI